MDPEIHPKESWKSWENQSTKIKIICNIKKKTKDYVAKLTNAEIPTGILAGIAQLTIRRLQTSLVQCPAALALKGTAAVRAAGPLDTYVYEDMYPPVSL